MDFKSLITKISEMDDKIETVAAPKLPKTVKLNEDAELRVLAGTSSILEEAKKMKKEEKKEKVDEGGLDMNLLKAAQKGQEGKPVGKPDAESDKNVKKKYGYRMDGEPAERDDDPTKQERRGRKRKNEDVEIDAEQFKAKFSKMVEAKKDDKKKKPMKEAAKPDFLDVDKDGDKKEPMKKAAAEKGGEKKDGKKGMSAKQAKYFGGKKTESKMMPKGKKRPVKESVEGKMSFRDMMKLVIESGGQQQIDPVDQTLWAWANRVAGSKIQESQKAEIFAAMIYERNGGRFEMYDVLSEDQK